MSPTFLGLPTTPPRGSGNLRGTEPFPAAAHTELGNTRLRRNVDEATRTILDKRLRMTDELPDWEQLRRPAWTRSRR